MTHLPSHRFAVIADAHFHDPGADFGFDAFREGDRRLALRLPGDVARAPRIYNEAGAILCATLEALADREIRDVVLLGDYSDDGQAITLAALAQLLDRFRRSSGMRFFALPGNHDLHGEKGRHRRKRYADAAGESLLVTSDPDHADPRGGPLLVNAGMYCGGYPDNLPEGCGFFGDPGCLHFETPFGTDPDPDRRRYSLLDATGSVRRRLMDASYVVEPVEGLWFVMIDANVFTLDPDGDDGLADSTAAGWTALLSEKPFLLDWLADIHRRAGALGKRVIHFSHYPVLETLNGTLADEVAMMGAHAFQRRMPSPAVGQAVLDAGMRLHFSGHVHVNDVALLDGAGGEGLVNIAVPALVAFPAAAKIVTVTENRAEIETLPLDSISLDPLVMAASRRLGAINGVDTGRMLEADSLGALLDAHLQHVTARRFLKREWPEDLAAFLRRATLLDLLGEAGVSGPVPEAVAGLSAVEFLADWYRLRAGGDLAERWIGSDRLSAYRQIAARWSQAKPADGRLQLLLKTLARHLEGIPTARLIVDLATGQADFS